MPLFDGLRTSLATYFAVDPEIARTGGGPSRPTR